jgi:hypothetical protein
LPPSASPAEWKNIEYGAAAAAGGQPEFSKKSAVVQDESRLSRRHFRNKRRAVGTQLPQSTMEVDHAYQR